MEVKKIDKNGYRIYDGDECLGGAFCGIVPDSIVERRDFMLQEKVATIMGFYVSESGKGIGSLLLEGIMEQEREKGIVYLNLGVAYNNERAKGLYEKFGFKQDGLCAAGINYHYMWVKL